MEITATRREGIGAIVRTLGPVDTASLGSATQAIVAEVDAVQFFDLPAEFHGEGQHPDPVVTTLSIVDGSRQHSVTWADYAHDSRIAHLAAIISAVEQTGTQWV